MEDSKEKKLLEEDLYKPVHDFLENQGYTVRAEVDHCDVAAIKDETLLIVELKKNLTVELLSQAVNRQKAADIVYMAIPKPQKMKANSKWKDICYLIKRLELGLIFVNFKGKQAFVEVAIEAKSFDFAKSKSMAKRKRNHIIKEMQGRNKDLNVGGSKGKKLVTSYRENSIFIACCLNKFGPMSPKKLREIGTDCKKTVSILYKNYYGWFEKKSRGVYELNDEGKKNLEVYEELANYYYEKLDK